MVGSTFLPHYIEWAEEPQATALSSKDVKIVNKYKNFEVSEDPEWYGEKYESSGKSGKVRI